MSEPSTTTLLVWGLIGVIAVCGGYFVLGLHITEAFAVAAVALMAKLIAEGVLYYWKNRHHRVTMLPRTFQGDSQLNTDFDEPDFL